MYDQREKPKKTIKDKNRPETRSVVTNRVRLINDYDEVKGDFLGHPANGGLNGLLQRQPKGRVSPIVSDYFQSQSSTIQRVDHDDEQGENEKTDENLDNLQSTLALLGMLPGVGIVADAANVGVSLYRGNYADALINIAAMAPLVGQGVTGTKLGVKVASTVTDALAATSKTTTGAVGKVVDELAALGNTAHKTKAGDIAADADKVTEAATGLVKEMSDKLPIPVERMKGVFKAEHTGKTGTVLGKDVVPDRVDDLVDYSRNAKAFSKDPSKWSATRPKGTQLDYKVFQRNDIDWDHVRTTGDKRFIGKTNAEAAARGLSPQLPDGNFATLHHLGQKSPGPLVEASTRYHGVGKLGQDILHSQYGRSKPHPTLQPDRKKFDVDTREYWKWRLNNRGE